MCRRCISSIHHGLGLPLAVADNEARRVYQCTDLASAEVIKLLGTNKKPIKPLQPLTVDKWAYAVGFTYESYKSIFLAANTDLLLRAKSYLDPDKHRVRWEW